LLKERIRTAIILGIVLLAVLFVLPIEIFTWAALAIFAYGAYEWSKLAEIKTFVARLIYSAGAAAIGAAVYFYFLEGKLWTIDFQIASNNKLIMSLACVWWVVSSALVFIYPRGKRIWQHQPVVKAVFGYLTLVPAWLALVTLREWHYDTSFYSGAWLALFVFGIVWAADIGAYFAGKRFGSHKLMPNVSPGKTIEGLLGGVIAVAILTALVLWGQDIDTAHWPILIISSVVLGVISAFGDLSESMLKRDAGMKDSGTIFPGHGGLLDRIDSLTAAMPVFIVIFGHYL